MTPNQQAKIAFQPGAGGEEGVGNVEQLLEVAVPRRHPQVGVYHGYAVAHVAEGDAQLGLAIAQLLEQPGTLHRDNRLRREVLQQRDLSFVECSHLLAIDRHDADDGVLFA